MNDHCNMGLGLFREQKEVMKKAVDYLKENE